MNKRTVQAFALGILFSSITLYAGTSAIADKEPKQKATVSEAKKLLETKGYKVLSSNEYAQMSEKEAAASAAKPKAEAPAEKPKEEPAEKKEPKKFTLVIAGGMTPGDVAAVLKSQGLIDDETKFERFLIDKGYHTKVQIGRYELTTGLDYHQIAKIITKNR